MNNKMTILAICACTSIAVQGADNKVSVKKDEAAARKAVRGSLKDPDSARFGKFSLGGKYGACLTVNAKNAYGGYTGDQQAFLRRTAAPGLWSVGLIESVTHEYCLDYVSTTYTD